MKIFNHPLIESEKFHKISAIEEIKTTPPNSTLFIPKFDIEIAKFCQKNFLPYSMVLSSIKEGIFANLLGCKYGIADKNLAKELTPIAQNYLFDMEILAIIQDDIEIEEMAKVGVDGVIFQWSKKWRLHS